MDHVELRRLDLNLLLAFDLLVEEASVTRAAERMMVGQPAMSASLAKLRRFFDDQLLVRQGRGLVPTTRARELAPVIRDALNKLETTFRSSRSFDPTRSSRTFSIMASDYVLLLLIGPLLARLRIMAPDISFQILPPTEIPVPSLTNGEADIVLFPDELMEDSESIRCAPLFTDRLVCAIDRDHPYVGDVMSIEQFGKLPLVSYGGSPMNTISGVRLRDAGWARTSEVVTQSLVVQPMLLPGTELMALIPERLGLSFVDKVGLRLLDPPVQIDELRESIYWPMHCDADPGHQWLRDQILDAARQWLPTAEVRGT